MKRRRVLIIAAGVFVAVVLVVVLWPVEREPEPEYNGKSLSDWLDYAPGVPPRILRLSDGRVLFDAQIDAVQHMGTNGTALLVRWVQYEPPKWRLKMRESVARTPQAWRPRLYSWFTPAAEWRAARAAAVLRELRSEELPMDVLDRIAADAKKPYAARRVKSLLMEIRMRQSFQRKLQAQGKKWPSPLAPLPIGLAEGML